MHEFLGSNKYAVGNGKQNCFLLLETENLKAKQSMCLVVCVRKSLFGKQFLRNGFKNGVAFLKDACKTLT